MFRKFVIALFLVVLPVMAFGYPTDLNKPTKTITDADITGVTVWSKDTVYILNDQVFVEDGEVLVIEPGTIIKGEQGVETNSKFLLVARGGKIYAVGTPCEPIIFTSVLDDVWDTNDIVLDETARGLWGGVLVCGIAPINDPKGWGAVEGIDPTETRGRYGVGDPGWEIAADPCDNSGAMKYVSVRHGGTDIGEANEINGWTFAAVGCGTEINYLEAFYNNDDGYEWFGGTVVANHLVAAYCKDDSFDWDEGFRGGGQFWFCIQTGFDGDNGGEHDGAGQQDGAGEDEQPFGMPVVSNVTYIGPQGGRALTIRDNTAGAYYNSVFTEFRSQGIRIEWKDSQTTDSYQRLLRGQVKLYNNVWYNLGGNTSAEIAPPELGLPDDSYNPGSCAFVASDSWVDYILFHDFDENNLTSELRCDLTTGAGVASANWVAAGHDSLNWKNYLSTADVVTNIGDKDVSGIPLQNGTLDPRVTGLGNTFLNDYPSENWLGWVDPFDADDRVGFHPDLYDDGSACDGGIPVYDECCGHDFVEVDYPGAFDPNSDNIWIAGWTAIAQYGILSSSVSVEGMCDCTTDDGKPEVDIFDADIDGFTHFSNDNVYVLNELVFVEDGEVLYIEPGTVVKGLQGVETNAKALIVARGAQGLFLGSECCPIVFTSILDDVDEYDDIILDETARGLWGGVLILGIGPINDPKGWGAVEGIDPTETRGRYGVGDAGYMVPADPMDNSGIYRYVSVRHGGTDIGEANEINGWTFGAVGQGTTVDHCEAFYNNDDGYEWFGGNVICNNLIASYCKDDAFDWDEGFRGGGQFWFTVKTCFDGDNGGEHDGAGQQDGAGDDETPYATPLVSNATYLGPNGKRALSIRDNSGGAYYNSIFSNYSLLGVRIEYKNSGVDYTSYQRLLHQSLKLYNNIWSSSDASTLAPVDPDLPDDTYNPGGCSFVTSGSWVEYVIFHDFVPSNLTSEMVSACAWPNDDTQNWQNYLSEQAVVNNNGDCVIDGAPNGTLDPRAACLDNTFLLDDASASWSAWVDPCDSDIDVGFHPEVCDGALINWPEARSCDFAVVDFPGAFDPAVSMNESWATFSATFCHGFFGDNEATCGGCCIGTRGDIDLEPNCSPEEQVADIGDLTNLINHLFISFDPICCPDEADIAPVDTPNPGDVGDGIVDIGDLTAYINYLFITFVAPGGC